LFYYYQRRDLSLKRKRIEKSAKRPNMKPRRRPNLKLRRKLKGKPRRKLNGKPRRKPNVKPRRKLNGKPKKKKNKRKRLPRKRNLPFWIVPVVTPTAAHFLQEEGLHQQEARRKRAFSMIAVAMTVVKTMGNFLALSCQCWY
jgi:hypothetical protein